MSLGILGYKVGMTSVFDSEGKPVPVTVLSAGPCPVVQRKNAVSDNNDSIQIGCGAPRKSNKPATGHFKASGSAPCRHLKEFSAPVAELDLFPVGEKLTVKIFEVGEKVSVSGKAIGKGFQGVVKRHGFHGGPATHGSMSHRAPGSIGGSNPDRVLKGKRMAGRMGGKRVTVKNLEVVRVEEEKNLIFLKGAIPGSNGTFVEIRKNRPVEALPEAAGKAAGTPEETTGSADNK